MGIGVRRCTPLPKHPEFAIGDGLQMKASPFHDKGGGTGGVLPTSSGAAAASRDVEAGQHESSGLLEDLSPRSRNLTTFRRSHSSPTEVRRAGGGGATAACRRRLPPLDCASPMRGHAAGRTIDLQQLRLAPVHERLVSAVSAACFPPPAALLPPPPPKRPLHPTPSSAVLLPLVLTFWLIW